MPPIAQAGAHRLLRKAGDVLDAAIALFLDRRDQLAVAHERRRHVAVIGVEAENIHDATGSSAVKRSRNRSSVNCSRNRARPRAPIASVGGSIAQHAHDALEQLRAIARLDQQSGVAIGDDLGRRAAAADAGAGRPHRLDEHEPEPFVAARHHERRAPLRTRAAAPRRRAGRETSRGRSSRSDAAFRSSRAPIVAVADDPQRRAGDGRGDVAPDLEQRIVPLVAFVRRHAADDERRRRSAPAACAAPASGSTPRWQTSMARPAKRGLACVKAIARELRDRDQPSGAIERRALQPVSGRHASTPHSIDGQRRAAGRERQRRRRQMQMGHDHGVPRSAAAAPRSAAATNGEERPPAPRTRARPKRVIRRRLVQRQHGRRRRRRRSPGAPASKCRRGRRDSASARPRAQARQARSCVERAPSAARSRPSE